MGWFKSIIGLYSEKVVFRTGSQFNPVLEVVENKNRLQLDTSHVNYSFGGLHKAFQELFIEMNLAEPGPKKVLILGFGAGSIASILQIEYKFNCSVTGIEIDPEVIALGRRFFRLDLLPDATVIEEDAFVYMEQNRDKFDLVVVDLYLDMEVPIRAETHEFAAQLRNALSEYGQLVFNKYVYNKTSGQSAEELRKTLNKTFGNVKIYKTGHNQMNLMIVCEND